jgi:uncharacterized caspase-like protein
MMRKVFAFFALALAALMLQNGACSAAADGKRIALVIGNSDYAHAVSLPNPKNDAKLMAETMRAAGFSVIEGENLDKAGMGALLDRFTEEAYDAQVALLYYAGHGLQVDGQNYLVPTDAQLEKAAQLQTRTIPMQAVIAALPPDPAVGIVILDACRDNPLARTLAAVLPASRSASVAGGLAPVQASGQASGAGGLLIAYATDPGAVAYDGKGVHSPYTSALARHLTTPGLEIQSALTRVRADVAGETGGAQRPWHNASLAREVFLGGQAPAQAPPAVAQAGDAPGDVGWMVEQRLWDEASKRNTPAHYRLYLEQFPQGRFAAIARLNLEQIEADGAKEVASLAPADAGASQARTAVAVPDEVRRTPGTAATEALVGLDRDKRVDLQLRLSALGHDAGSPDGSIGPRSRAAIGAWQKQSGIAETTYLTPEQYMLLTVQTDPLMPAVRERRESAKAATARQRKETPVAKRRQARPAAGQDTVVVRRRADDSNKSAADAAFVGGLMGGAIGGLIGR